MKWSLTSDKKEWKNYKGEVFKGKMAKDLNIGDQVEQFMDDNKQVLVEVKKREVTEKGAVCITLIGGVVNG